MCYDLSPNDVRGPPMLGKVLSCAVYGLEASLVSVEVDLASGLPLFAVVGLPDAAVKESKDRVRAAIKNSGFSFPVKKITVNLAPADLKKEGSAFDLPMAVGILSAEGVVPETAGSPLPLQEVLIIGELSLDGTVRGVHGALPMAAAARRLGLKGVILPAENAAEAAVVDGVAVYGVSTLPQVVELLAGRATLAPTRVKLDHLLGCGAQSGEDFSDVKGQEQAKRALEIAAAGGHHLLMIGPPGSGKTMLAQRLPTILPELAFEEAIETTTIHSVTGSLRPQQALIGQRPFRSPHHTISDAGMIGGGQVPRPGEVSLAHHGVLFLDELPEFRRNVLEVLRQPLESGRVTIARATASLSFPARFMLVAAMNPCPCGFFTDPQRACHCTPPQIQRYRAKISGPLLDRIDVQIEVPAVPFRELSTDRSQESSTAIRSRVMNARAVQRARYLAEGIACNAELSPKLVRKYCRVDDASKRLLELAMQRLGLSARAYGRILKVARTIADLDGRDAIQSTDVAEAIAYRSLDRGPGDSGLGDRRLEGTA